MPDLHLTWRCAECGKVETVHARSRHLSDTVTHFKPRGWLGRRGPNRTGIVICPQCQGRESATETVDETPLTERRSRY